MASPNLDLPSRDGPCALLIIIDAMIRGGGPGVCYNLIRTLPAEQFRPCLVTLFEQGSLGEVLAAEGVPSLSLSLQHPFNLFQLRRGLNEITSFARVHQIRLVHAHLTAAGIYGGLAARRIGVPAVFTVHGELTRRVPLRFIELGLRQLFPVLVAVSQRSTEEVRSHIVFRESSRVLHIYNGIDTHYWCPTGEKSRTGGGIQVVMVANFFREKDHATAVNGFRYFVQKYPDSRLVLAGEGEGRGRIEELVERLAVPNITFAGGVTDIRGLLCQADIFMLTSFSEGISLAVLEAMAMGLPVVASDVGGMREILTHGVDGLLVSPGDPAALFRALDLLAQDPGFRRSLGERARTRVEETFSLASMTSAYIALYRDLLEKKR